MSFTYDGRGFPDLTRFEHTGASGTVVVDHDHDMLGFLTRASVTGPGLDEPVVTSFEPDPNRNLEALTRPRGARVTNTFDHRGRLVTVEERKDALVRRLERTYDAAGNLLTETRARTDSTSYGPSFTYDGHGRPHTRTSARGQLTTTTHGKGGLLESEVAKESAEPDARTLHETTLAHDPLGFLEKRSEGPDRPASESFTPSLLGYTTARTDRRGRAFTLEHYANGWLRKETDPLGNVTEYTYHPLGGVATLTKTDAGGTPLVVVTNRYDELGRLVASRDAAGHETRRTYDSRGNVRTATDALGKTTRFSYDALDRPLRVEGPEGELVKRSFDPEGRITTYTDANGNTTRYAYDGLGRLETLTYPGLAPYRYTYFRDDLLETETTPRGYVATIVYDEDGNPRERRVEKDGVAVETEELEHDLLGRLTRARNAAATVERKLDGYGLVTEEKLTVLGLEAPRTLTRELEAGHGPKTLRYPGGRTLGFVLDGLGRIDLIREGVTTRVDYDWRGPDRLETKTLQGELVSSYTYDGERMLETLAHTSSGRKLLDWTVDFTARHEAREEQDALRGGARSLFGYDEAGRLERASYVVEAGRPEGEGRRRSAYGVDGVRNLSSWVERVGGEFRREREGEVAAGNRLRELAGELLEYDAEGNLTRDDRGFRYEYDWKNRLVKATKGSSSVAYAYDALDRKVKREAGGVARYFGYDGWRLLEEADEAGATTLELLSGAGVDEPLVFWDGGGKERRLFTDRLGSVLGVVDGRGELLERYEYGAWGTLRRARPARLDGARLEDAKTLVLRFTGELDAATVVGNLIVDQPGEARLSADRRELRYEAKDDFYGIVRVMVKETMRSVFGFGLEGGEVSFSFEGADHTPRALHDEVAPRVEQVAQEPDGTLLVRFSEPVTATELKEGFRLGEKGVPTVALGLTAT